MIEAVKEGRAVLFLGAGASRGAQNDRREEIPDGRELAKILAHTFLGSDYQDLDLRSTYDLACTMRDTRTVQRKVFEVLNPFQPAPFHALIPKFAWAGLATTNYDLLIERAYQQNPNALQRVVPNTKDGDGSADEMSDGSILYLKLHGCITRHGEVEPPLIASTEQLIGFRNHRNGQIATFLEWAKTKTVIFCGYSFLDQNLRTLFDEIVKEGDNRPRHFIINKGLRTAEASYWSDRRVAAIDSTFESFLESLDASISENQRALGIAMAAVTADPTSFTRFITQNGGGESAELRRYLTSFIEHIGPELDPPKHDARKFYRGFEQGWYPVAANLDVRQPIVDELMREVVLVPPVKGKPYLTVIKGHAGSGKSVVLRRLCFEAAKLHSKLCFFVSREHLLHVERFEEIFRLTDVPVYLFLDNAAEHRDELKDLLALASRMRVALTVIATETFNTWNVTCEELEPRVSRVAEMKYLSEANIRALIEKLEEHGSLGYLQRLSADERVHELKHVHGRQLLVALLEATHGVPLMDIVAAEYESITPASARLLYLDICSLHRFGPPVRAGLIARVHDLSFNDFGEKFLRPLEEIVVLRRDQRSGDYVYEARHSHIAHTVYETVVKSQDERFSNLVRVVSKLNPSYSYDREVIGRIIRADNLRATLGDEAKIRQVYDVAQETAGEWAVIYHQRGLFEMQIAGHAGALGVAEDLLKKAAEIEPRNLSIRHTLAELDLKRARFATDLAEKSAWRARAASQAAELLNRGNSPYPHHTLLKIAIDAVKDALDEAEDSNSEAASEDLSAKIAEAERVLKRGLQAFPNESFLLAEEGEFSKVLAEAVRAESAFQNAFDANPRSVTVARRLGRIKRSKGAFLDARSILQKCLEFNPASQELHYDIAMSIIESAPDADQTQSDLIIYHLRRSFAPGDKSRQAQFWYARQLSISGRYEEARPIFKGLWSGGVPHKERRKVIGVVMKPGGEPRQFLGTITTLAETYGFVRCDELELDAFFYKPDFAEAGSNDLAYGDAVMFELGFNLGGPAITMMNT